jgi:hypothetical protein
MLVGAGGRLVHVVTHRPAQRCPDGQRGRRDRSLSAVRSVG